MVGQTPCRLTVASCGFGPPCERLTVYRTYDQKGARHAKTVCTLRFLVSLLQAFGQSTIIRPLPI